jgi:hypothetical protein
MRPGFFLKQGGYQAQTHRGDSRKRLVARRSIRSGPSPAAPGFGDRRKAMLENIAILTGGTVVSSDLGVKLENVTIQMLGRTKKVMIEKENTTIVNGAGKADIETRITQIRAQIEDTTSDYDREKLQERLAKLAGGVAVIRVGGNARGWTGDGCIFADAPNAVTCEPPPASEEPPDPRWQTGRPAVQSVFNLWRQAASMLSCVPLEESVPAPTADLLVANVAIPTDAEITAPGDAAGAFLHTTLQEGGKPVRIEAVTKMPAGQGPFPLLAGEIISEWWAELRNQQPSPAR